MQALTQPRTDHDSSSSKTLNSVGFPTADSIVEKLDTDDGRYNGYHSLLDAFLALLPDTFKSEAYNGRVEALYRQVKRRLFSPITALERQTDQAWFVI